MFSAKVRKKLGVYVYLYIDPRTGRPFYLGKGVGNRAFAHLSTAGKSRKAKILRELRKLGLKPTIEILKHGLDDSKALLVESTAIDLFGIEELANEVRGHKQRHGRRASIEEINALYDAKPVKIKESVVLINITRAFRYGMTPIELYDATRSAWKLDPVRARKAEFAFSVYLGVVREVYRIKAWLEGGSVMRSTDPDGRHRFEPKRWEFVGQAANEQICKRYVDKSVQKYFPKGSQNPIRYVNC